MSKQTGTMKALALILAILMALAFTACKPGADSSSGGGAGASDQQSAEEGESTAETASGEDANSAGNAAGSKTSGAASKAKSTAPVASKNWGTDVGTKSPDPLEQGVNLKGYNFKIIGFDTDNWGTKTGVSNAEDIRIQMIKNIETKLNCKIQFTQLAGGTFFSTLQPKILSGEKVADIIAPTMYEAGAFISAGLVKPFNDVKNINISRDYWNQNFNKVSTINSKTYAVSCDYVPHMLDETAIFFNKTIAKEMNLDLYTTVQEGKWTIDAFNKMCQDAYKDVDTVKGRSDGDRYGLAAPNWTRPVSLFVGSGIKVFDNVGGKVVFNFKPTASSAANTDAIAYLNKLKPICAQGEGSTYIKANQSWSVTLDQFAAGKSLFFLQMASTVSNPEWRDKFRNMKDDYGILPIPNAKGGKIFYNQVDWNSKVWMVPATNKESANTGLILDAIAYHAHYDYNIPHLNEWCSKYLRDKESVEMVELLQKHPAYDLLFFAGNNNPKILNAIDIIVRSCEVKAHDPAQAIPMHENAIRSGIDVFFNN